MSTFDLLELPVELILQIIESFSVIELVAFARTSKSSWRMASPILKSRPFKHVEEAYKWACCNDNPQAMLLLLPIIQRAARTRPEIGYEALVWACNSSCAEAVRILVDDGIPFGPPRYERPTELEEETPLHCAMRNKHPEALKVLLDAGAVINIITDDHTVLLYSRVAYDRQSEHGSFLHYAAIKGWTSVVHVLVPQSLDVNCLDSLHATPLSLAAEMGHDDMVKLLLAQNAKVHTVDNQGRTALSWAAAAGHTRITSLLLDAGAQVNLADKCGYTPLMRATVGGHLGAVDRLLKQGADIDQKNRLGRSPLSVAASSDLHEMVQFLVDRGADIDKGCSRFGRTALSYAVEKSAIRACRVLVEAGCDTKKRDHRGRPPAYFLRRPLPELVRLLRRN